MKKVAFITAIIGLVTLLSGQLYAQDYKVIVNTSNTVSTMTKTQVSKLFLRKAIYWDNGRKAYPVDLIPDSTVRQTFSEEIHRKRISAVTAYWQKMIFSGRAVPPPEKPNDSEIIAYVRANPDAIGYVSISAQTGDVKVVRITQ